MTVDPTAADDSQPSVTLYGAKTGNCLRVSIALEEAFVPYHVAHIDLSAGGQHQAEYVKLNPLAKVPTLVDALGPNGPHVISQSNAILLYLSEKAPGRLVPFERGLQRYRALERFLFFVTDVIAPSHAAFHLTQATDGRNSKELQAKAVSALCLAERFAPRRSSSRATNSLLQILSRLRLRWQWSRCCRGIPFQTLRDGFATSNAGKVSCAASKRSIVSEHGLTSQIIKETHVPRAIGLIGVDPCFSCLR